MTSLASKRVKTVLLILIWVVMGLSIEVFGPTMIDLTLLYDVNYETLGRSVAGRGVGGLVGGLVCGVLTDRFEGWLDLMTSLVNGLGAIAVMLVPFTRNADVLWCLCFLLGFGVSAVNIGGQRLLILMWKEKAAAPTFALHMGFGIGAFLIPLVANPFLAVLKYDTSDMLGNTTTTIASITAVSTANGTSVAEPVGQYLGLPTSPVKPPFTKPIVVEESRIMYVYLIVGVSMLILSLPFCVFQCRRKNDMVDYKSLSKTGTSSKTLKEMLNPCTYTGGSIAYGVTIFGLLFVYYFNCVGSEQMFGTFIRSFSVDLLHFGKDNASYLNMAYWLSFTAGRLIGALLALFWHVKWLILFEVSLNMVAVILLNIYAVQGATMSWVCTALQGLVVAPLFPAGVAFANTIMEVSGMCLMMIGMGASSGDFAYIWLAGKVYDKYGPAAILYGMLSAGILILLSVTILRLVSRGKPEHYSSNFDNVKELSSTDGNMTLSSMGEFEEAVRLMSSEDEL